MPDPAFDLERIVQDSFISAVEYHECIPSTNTRGLELASRDDLQLPLLILANEQSAGRGRGKNQWWSSGGALTFSVLLDSALFSIPQHKISLVSLATGLAIAEALEAFLAGRALQLKWPNDVYFNGRKLCGILAETSSRRPGSMVIGIGVNVNNSLSNAPIELKQLATSLVDVTGREFNRTEVVIAILQKLGERLAALNADENLPDSWQPRCYLQGKTVQLDVGSRRITGVCQGIDEQGALLLHTECGMERCFGGVVVRTV